MKEPKNILVFRLSSIGDIILSTALIRSIKTTFPNSSITLVIKKEFYDIVKYNKYIKKVTCFNKKDGFTGLLKLKREIRISKYDWFVDIHNNIRSNIIKRGSGIPLKTRYHKRIFKRILLVSTKINLYKEDKPVLLRYFEAVEKIGVFYDGKGTDVPFSDKEINSINTIIKESGINNEKMAILCPGASFKNKQWKIEGFGEVVIFLLKKGFDVILIGGKNDIDTCNQIISLTDKKVLNLAGKTSLLESAALLKQSKITITNDSGMMHMAQSQKSPVVAIFGPTTKELGYFPQPEKSCVVEVEVSCRPCTHKGLDHCPKKHFKCMKLIESCMVTEKIEELI